MCRRSSFSSVSMLWKCCMKMCHSSAIRIDNDIFMYIRTALFSETGKQMLRFFLVWCLPSQLTDTCASCAMVNRVLILEVR